MYRFTLLFVPLALLTFQLACQPERNKKRSIRPVVLSTEPVVLPASNGECLDPGLNLAPVGDIGLVDLEGVSPEGKLDLMSYNFSGVFEPLGLSSSAVSITHSSREVTGECHFNSSSQDEQMLCNNQAIPAFDGTPSSPTRICGEIVGSRDETQESIALQTARYVQDAFDFYNLATKESLPRVVIESLPLISVLKLGRQNTERFFHVDNAYYEPRGNKVLVLPPSKKYLLENKPLLPQSSYVIGHEMAHAVQSKLIMETLGRATLLRSSHWDGQFHEFVMDQDEDDFGFEMATDAQGKTQVFKLTGAAPQNRQSYAAYIGSIFEGFADMLPYYQFGGRTETLLPFGCFFPRTRDINTPHHGNHPTRSTLKILSPSVFDELFNSSLHSIDSFAYCEGPQFQDSHAVGGVISFLLNRALAEALPDPGFDTAAFSDKLTGSMRLRQDVSVRRYLAVLEWFRLMIKKIDRDFEDRGAVLTEREATEFIVSTIYEVSVESKWVKPVNETDSIALRDQSQRKKAVCEVFKRHVSLDSVPAVCRS